MIQDICQTTLFDARRTTSFCPDVILQKDLKKFLEFARRLGKLVRPLRVEKTYGWFETKQKLTAQNYEKTVISQVLKLAE